MKKIFITIVAFAAIATGAFAQTEAGKIYVGASSDLGFYYDKADGADDGASTFGLDVNGGYFVIDNLSVNAQLGFGYSKFGDADAQTEFTFGVGARYYLPMKIFFGAMFDYTSTNPGGDADAQADPGLTLGAGYALFLNDNIAIEPFVGYRLGFGDKDKGLKHNEFGIKIGFGIYF